MAPPDLTSVETAVQGLLAGEAADLVDLQYRCEGGRWVLRFFVDKPGGTNLDDCEYFSNRIGGLLDASDLMPHRYVLEVSSPGLDRRLKRPVDFLRFLGHRAKVRLKAPAQGRRHFTGFIKSYEDGRVVLEAGEHTATFALDAIDEARLDPEIKI